MELFCSDRVPEQAEAKCNMHSGYGGDMMEVGGLTVQPPCGIVYHDARDQAAWLDSHMVGLLQCMDLFCCDRVPEHPEEMCTCTVVMAVV
jgi:hypothetical protein